MTSGCSCLDSPGSCHVQARPGNLHSFLLAHASSTAISKGFKLAVWAFNLLINIHHMHMLLLCVVYRAEKSSRLQLAEQLIFLLDWGCNDLIMCVPHWTSLNRFMSYSEVRHFIRSRSGSEFDHIRVKAIFGVAKILRAWPIWMNVDLCQEANWLTSILSRGPALLFL